MQAYQFSLNRNFHHKSFMKMGHYKLNAASSAHHEPLSGLVESSRIYSKESKNQSTSRGQPVSGRLAATGLLRLEANWLLGLCSAHIPVAFRVVVVPALWCR